MEKAIIEIEWKEDSGFNLDKAVDEIVFKEFLKCEKFDVKTKHGRTCYGPFY